MKTFQALMGAISLIVLLVIVLVIKSSMSPVKLQKAMDSIDNVFVQFIDPGQLDNYTKRKIIYSIKATKCNFSWIFSSYTYNNKSSQFATLKYQYDKKCTISLKNQIPLHKKILTRAFLDWDKNKMNHISIPSVQTLDPSGSINRNIIIKALVSQNINDYKMNYPNHKSKLSSNQLLINLINENDLFNEIVSLFSNLGLDVKLKACEKVFTANKRRAKDVGFDLPPKVRSVFYDAGHFELTVLKLK